MTQIDRDHALAVDGNIDNAALQRLFRKACREKAGDVLLLSVGPETGAASAAGASGWVAQLASADALPVVIAEGTIGPRCLALILLADLVMLTPDAVFEGSVLAVPNLPELSVMRLGPIAGRRLAFSADPLEWLVSVGHCQRSQDPWSEMAKQLGALPDGGITRLRKGWRAVRDLAFDEALGFGQWLDRPDIAWKETA